MPSELSFVAAFLVGLSGGVHCIAMCGGISAALGFAAGQEKANNLLFALAYNAGRIGSYTIIGFLFGGLLSLFDSFSTVAHRLLQIFSSLLLIGIGLHISGIYSRLDILEKPGTKIWAIIQPLALKLFPVTTLPKALAFGFCWGWLPCGLVYSTLSWSASSASATTSAGMMAAFGMGTLPWLLLATIAGQQLRPWTRSLWLKRCLGGLLVLIGCYGLYLNSVHTNTPTHEHHQHH